VSASRRLRETASKGRRFPVLGRGGFSIKMQHYVTRSLLSTRINPRKISAEPY
jgi:hypothetical protein